jgi:hypothetical protein
MMEALKRQHTSFRLHGATTQKTAIFKLAAVKTYMATSKREPSVRELHNL